MRRFGALAGVVLAVTSLAGFRLQATEPGGIDAGVIRNLRHEYNLAISSHDAGSFTKFLSPTFVEMASSGEVTRGAGAVAESYAAIEFKDPAFLAYDRRPDTIEVADNGRFAVERGHWRAIRRGQGREVGASGLYQAGWVHSKGTWRIQSEAYVKMACALNGPC